MVLKELTKVSILNAFENLAARGQMDISSSQLLEYVKTSPATLKRHLDSLVTSHDLIRSGKARATRYRLAKPPHAANENSKPISPAAHTLRAALLQPLGSRTPVTYQRYFVDQYVPNKTFLLPEKLSSALYEEGRMRGQQPAGTYARKVLEHLLIDLSWSSSRLEGNKFTLLATKELFERGANSGETDAIMLLNHKRAIEFLVEAVPEYGLTSALIRNLHSLLMQDLLDDPKGLGEIRTKIVHISDTVYIPAQVPTLLEEMLNLIIERARQVKNPIEAAFFLWVNLAYLQPFEDGNKRTSRLSANIPLLLYNCAPLSFLDIEMQEYAYAMIGVYERLDTSLAIDLFTWIYRRSIQKYAAIMESLGGPDPFRLKYREQLSAAVQMVVRDGQNPTQATRILQISKNDGALFTKLLQNELSSLTVHNCARHRVTMKMVETWMARKKK